MLRRCMDWWWCCGGGGGCDDDGLVWEVALKPHATGEFSMAVAQANAPLEDQAQVLKSPSATYVGVYDGHGGPEAARFVHKRLISSIRSFASENGGLSVEVLKKAFNATEEDFLHNVKKDSVKEPRKMQVGSCCLVGAVEEGMLYLANLGDSRVVLGRRNGWFSVEAERLSRDHNVSEEEVRKELTEQQPDVSDIVVNCHGVWRIKGIIQVSRSIGDFYLKNPEIIKDPVLRHNLCPPGLKRPVLTAVPSIRIRKLQPQDLFLIFGSDGLWEQLTDEDAVKIVINNPRQGIAKRLVKAAQRKAAMKKDKKYEELMKIEKGVRRYVHDDITVVVLFLDNRKDGSSRLKGGTVDSTSAPADIVPVESEDPSRPVLSKKLHPTY